MSLPASVLLIAGSPSGPFRSAALLDSVGHRLAQRGGFAVERLNIRELPARALLWAKWEQPAIAALIVVALALIVSFLLMPVARAQAARDKVELRIGYQKAASLFVLQKAQGTLEKRLAPLNATVKGVEFPAGPQLLEGPVGRQPGVWPHG